MEKEAKFWKSLENNFVQCYLCNHKCKIGIGNRGICGVRKNINGKLFSLIYGTASSVADDPIEKKPLYHFYPGSIVLSLGTVGCNFKCLNCQNYGISTIYPENMHVREISSEYVVKLAKDHNCKGIAWTYNEPTIWHEFTFDTSKLAKNNDLYTVYVTNGYINEDALKEIAPYLDAMNIDVKAFDEKFYKNVCKAKLKPVLDTCELAKKLDIHIELTYLVIDKKNDGEKEIRDFCSWIIDRLGSDIPVHFSRFHPDYKMTDVQATPVKTLLKIYDNAKKQGLNYVYLGNVPHDTYENTYCPTCGTLLIERYGFSSLIQNIENNRCKKCKKIIPIIGK